MAMGSICANCMNRFHCIIDSSVNVQRCEMYEERPDYSGLLERFADMIADRVVEKMRNGVTEINDKQGIAKGMAEAAGAD